MKARVDGPSKRPRSPAPSSSSPHLRPSLHLRSLPRRFLLDRNKRLRWLKWSVVVVWVAAVVGYWRALQRLDWPPRSGDPDEGAWWVSPNVTKAQRIMLVVAHRERLPIFLVCLGAALKG